MIRRGGGGGGRRTIGLGGRGASGKSTSWLTVVVDGIVGRETRGGLEGRISARVFFGLAGRLLERVLEEKATVGTPYAA